MTLLLYRQVRGSLVIRAISVIGVIESSDGEIRAGRWVIGVVGRGRSVIGELSLPTHPGAEGSRPTILWGLGRYYLLREGRLL